MAARGKGHGAGIRLRWWTLAAPAAAFTVLLTLMMSGTSAEAADQQQPVAELVGYLGALLVP
ncbi:hypothetical protein [Streptomyces sp. 7-21]|uniref:hypothetical protein n=1 Tax=Streptomyces sp. 7-21 TaxID=2802283 RepID=UPI001F347E61|nr:hypothetical protein [Streptomyces sp. 7-21]